MNWFTALIDDIDANRLHPRTHATVRRLVELQWCDDPLAAEVVEAFDTGALVPNERLLAKVWSKINETDLAHQGALRTLIALLQPDAPIDGYYAEYLIGWAQDEGCKSDALDAAFRDPR